MRPQSIVYIVDDCHAVRESIGNLLQSVDLEARTFETAKQFIDCEKPDIIGCLILDVRLPDMSGLQLHATLKSRGISLPVIFLTGYADVAMSVTAMKAGAFDFLCKPFREQDLLDAVRSAINMDAKMRKQAHHITSLRSRYQTLTGREREVMARVAAGMMNKVIAHELGICEITVKVHRANLKHKMQNKSLAELVRQADALHASN